MFCDCITNFLYPRGSDDDECHPPFQFLIHPKAHTNERLQVQSLLERQKRPDHRTEIFVEGAKALIL